MYPEAFTYLKEGKGQGFKNARDAVIKISNKLLQGQWQTVYLQILPSFYNQLLYLLLAVFLLETQTQIHLCGIVKENNKEMFFVFLSTFLFSIQASYCIRQMQSQNVQLVYFNDIHNFVEKTNLIKVTESGNIFELFSINISYPTLFSIGLFFNFTHTYIWISMGYKKTVNQRQQTAQ